MKIERTPTFLMANLGSEISQVFGYVENRELEMARSAAKRADIIIQELLSHPKLNGRTGEIRTLREIVQDLFSEKKQFLIKKNEIEEYFMPFALRVLSEQKTFLHT